MSNRRIYRPRWTVALLLVTLPIWFVPALLYVGWKETGRDVVSQILPGLKYLIMGKPHA